DDDAVKSAFDKLNQSQGKLGEAIYAQGQQADATAGAGANPGEDATASGAEGPSSSDEDVVDAEVIDDEDEKK
ncbi:MAG TPA: molecular chaperone DnaK, partial [Agromyces sp.]|nr:molecular chaperone DnaK [Agromyces sp.]